MGWPVTSGRRVIAATATFFAEREALTPCATPVKGTLEGGPGSDTITKYNCIGSSTLRGGSGDDYVEAYWNNAEGDNCWDSSLPDYVYGEEGRDIAEVNRHDVVRTVEEVTLYSGSIWD